MRFKDLSLADLKIETFSHDGYGEALRLIWDKDDQSGSLFLSDMGEHVERFEFADGTALSEIKLRDDGRWELKGTNGNDLIVGGAQNDYIHGGDGDDIIDPGAGVSAETGNWQNLRGNAGNDTYLIGRDGSKVYIQQSGEISGTDTVRLKDLTLEDLTFDTVAVEGMGEILQLRWTNGEENGFLRLSDMGEFIERFEFADGSVLSKIELLSGGGGD